LPSSRVVFNNRELLLWYTDHSEEMLRRYGRAAIENSNSWVIGCGHCDCRERMNLSDEEIIGLWRSRDRKGLCFATIPEPIDGEPVFELPRNPYGVDGRLHPLPRGELAEQARFLAVPVRNSSARAFASDLVLEISKTSHEHLAMYRAVVRDSWTSHDLLATGQEVTGSGVSLAGPWRGGRSGR